MTLTALMLLAAKVIATAGIVVTASVAVERVGPLIAGAIIGLPVTAGPGYAFLALSASDAFIARSALFSFQGILAILAFQATYIVLTPRLAALPVILGSLAVWFAVALAVERLALPFWLSVLCLGVAYASALRLGLHRNERGAADLRHATRTELVVRALLAGALVAGVVTIGEMAGESVTGVGLIFPVTLLAVGWIVRRRHGTVVARAVMGSALYAVPSFSACMATLHLLAEPLGRWPALAAALAVAGVSSVLIVGSEQVVVRLGLGKR